MWTNPNPTQSLGKTNLIGTDVKIKHTTLSGVETRTRSEIPKVDHLAPMVRESKPWKRLIIPISSCLCPGLSSPDVSPLSAPAFSFCFPLLNAMLRDSSGSTEESESLMTRALQVVEVHAELRAETEVTDTFIDEVRVDAPAAPRGRARGFMVCGCVACGTRSTTFIFMIQSSKCRQDCFFKMS